LTDESAREEKLDSERPIRSAPDVGDGDDQRATPMHAGQAGPPNDALHVGRAVQDFTSLAGIERLARVLAVARNFLGNPQHEARAETAHRHRDPVERDLDPRAGKAREHKRNREDEQIIATEAVDADARRARGSAEIPQSAKESDEARPLVQVGRARPGSIHGDLSGSRGGILAKSQESLINHVKLQDQVARLSARIDELSARERQLQESWRRLSMESQNRTQQNMGGN
jgi:hypothetical protein